MPPRNTSYIYAVPCRLISALWPHTLLLMTVQSNDLICCGLWIMETYSQQQTSFFSPSSTQQPCVKTLPQWQNLVYWEDTLSHEGHCTLLSMQEEEIREKLVYYITPMPYNSNSWIFDQYLATSSYGKGLSCSMWTNKALQRTFYRGNTGKSCHKPVLSSSPPFAFFPPQWHWRSLSALTRNLWDGTPL